MGFSRQEYWSGEPFPFPGDLPNRAIEPVSPASQPDSLPSEPPGKPGFNQQWLAFSAGCPREGSELPAVGFDLLKKEVRRKLWDRRNLRNQAWGTLGEQVADGSPVGTRRHQP